MNKSLLKSYALAIYSVAKENNQIEEVKSDLDLVCKIFRNNPSLAKFLSSPMIQKADKDTMLEDSIKSEIHLSVYSFLQILIKRKAIQYLPEIDKEFLHHYNQEKGILEGRIYTPFDMTDETISKLERIFSDKYQKKVVFRTIKDKRVIAGMKIYVDDTLYDYSVDTKLNQVRDNLLIKKI